MIRTGTVSHSRPRFALLIAALTVAMFTALAPRGSEAQLVYGLSQVTLDEVGLRSYGYSLTQLDYAACYYFDAAVDGKLYDNAALVDSGSAHGDCTAQVFNDAAILEDHTYKTESIHSVVAYFLVQVYYGFGSYDPYGYSAYGWHDLVGGFSYYGCNCLYYVLQASIPLARTTESKLYQQPCSRTPSLAGPASVTRGSTASFTLQNACPTAAISNWIWTDGVRQVSRGGSSAASWSGVMAASGTIRVTVVQGGRTHNVQAAVAVTPRAWAFAAKSPTQVGNGTYRCKPSDPLLTVPDPPTASGQAFGEMQACVKAAWTYSPPLVDGGPNQGFAYVTSVQDSTVFAWTTTPQIDNSTSDLYRAQCGRDGWIGGAQLRSNTISHERGLLNSHYSRYVAAQNSPANNVGAGLEAMVAPPGETSPAFGTRVQTEFDQRSARIVAAAQQEPCGASDVTKDENCTPHGAVNYSPYTPCSPLNLAVVGSSASQVTLSWTDGSFNETAFRVERSTEGTGFTILATLPAGTTSYSDLAIAANTTYVYRIRALGAAGVSAPSAELVVNPGGGPYF